MSVVDHTYHIMGEATQDVFSTMSSDIDYIGSTFSYLDELQAKAVERKVKRERAMAIVGEVLTIGFALLGAAGLFAEAIAHEASALASMVPFKRLLAAAGAEARSWNAAGVPLHLPFHTGTPGVAGALGAGATTAQVFEKQLQNVNAAAGGILGSAYSGVTGVMNQLMNVNHKRDE